MGPATAGGNTCRLTAKRMDDARRAVVTRNASEDEVSIGYHD